MIKNAFIVHSKNLFFNITPFLVNALNSVIKVDNIDFDNINFRSEFSKLRVWLRSYWSNLEHMRTYERMSISTQPIEF